MGPLRIVDVLGRQGSVDDVDVARLRSELQGQLLVPEDEGYDGARSIWNAMIDRRPALIARCADTSDVVTAMEFAREHRPLLAIRGGGHNIAGSAACDGGMVIDLSQMKEVTVDAVGRVAYVQPGATLADVDRETQAFALATPLGINSTTGVAGLTLGGGFGWLSRKHGLTVDNFVGATVVTADAKLVRASDEQDADLMWALRGGSGNFGIVTSFELALHPVGPEVLSGLMVFPAEQARQVLERYRDFTVSAPDELAVWVVMRQAPPLPFLPEQVHGKDVLVLAMFYADAPEDGERLIAPVRTFGDLLGEHVGVQPYVAWQQAFDPLLTPGARNYWKSHNLTELNDGAIGALVESAKGLPSAHCELFLAQLGGKSSRVPAGATAYPHRDAEYVLNVHGRWETESEDAAGIGWARSAFDRVAPHASGGVYVNFMTEDERDRVPAAYGASHPRLAEIKLRMDPSNLFRLNHNVEPAPPRPSPRRARA